MDVTIVETSVLGDRSYLVSAGGLAMVIDRSATSTAGRLHRRLAGAPQRVGP